MTAQRRRPRQQRSQQTVDWVLEAAAQLFSEHGYAGTTTNKVAERAGVSVGSVYQYFPNKDALLAALAERHLHEAAAAVLAAIERASAMQAPLPLLLREVITSIAEPHAAQPDLHSLLVRHALVHPGFADTVRATEREVAAALAAELTRLGIARPRARTWALLAVEGINAQIHGTLLHPPPGVSTAAMIDEITHMWTAALDPTRPHQIDQDTERPGT